MQETLQIDAAEQLELSFAEESPAPRCGSCGMEILDGDLCDACEQAFRSVLLTPPSTARASYAPAEEAVPGFTVVGPEFAPVEPASPDAESTSSPAALMSSAEPIRAAATAVEPIASRPETPSAADFRDLAMAGASRGNRTALLIVATVVITAFVGVPAGARWLANQRQAQLAAAQAAALSLQTAPQPPAAVHRPKSAPHTEPGVAASAHVATPESRASQTAPAATVRRGRAPRTPARPAQQSRVAEPVAAAVASDAALTALAPVAPPPPPSMAPVLAPARAAVVEAPAGRLFDPTEVDETPRILTRVPAQLPADVAAGSADVVIVRVLVSQTGHPFRISLLRRSKLGPAADDAAISAVRRWTFSPARKRGEAVSCWYNFGVSLGGN